MQEHLAALSGALDRGAFRNVLKAVAAMLDGEIAGTLVATCDAYAGTRAPAAAVFAVVTGALAPLSRRPAALLPLCAEALVSGQDEAGVAPAPVAAPDGQEAPTAGTGEASAGALAAAAVADV